MLVSNFGKKWLKVLPFCAASFSVLQLPAVAEGNASLAANLFARGDYKDAEPAFEALVKEDPADARARYYLALVYFKLARKELARTQFQKIISSAPASEEARFSQQYLTLLQGQNPIAKSAADVAPTRNDVDYDRAERDLRDANAQADMIRERSKHEADALLAQANQTAKDMEALPAAGRGSHGSAYSQDSINAATSDLKQRAAFILERGNREADDVLAKARLRHDTSAQVSANIHIDTTNISNIHTTSAAHSVEKISASASSIPRIDELTYWKQLISSGIRQDLHDGLMLKPQYRAEYLSQRMSVDEIKQRHYLDNQREVDQRWALSHQSAERAFSESGGVQISGYNINQFVGYRSGAGRFVDSDGICYKVFFDFVDAPRDLTPALYLEFVHALADAGFVGDSKVPMVAGWVRFNYNDIIVHAGSPDNARIAERVGLNLFNSRLAHHGRGLDIMQEKSGERWTQPIDWHHFLAVNTELSRLSPRALSYVNFAD
jgi:hypothetical protein